MKLGIALVCVAGVLLLGVGSAEAKVCSGSGTGSACGTGHGNVYTGPLVTEPNRFTFSNASSPVVICFGSNVEGEISNGEAGTGKITSMKFSSCNSNFGPTFVVTATASASAPWSLSISLSTAPDGIATIEGFTVTIQCETLICRYSAKLLGSGGEVVVHGGAKARLQFVNAAIAKEESNSVACGSMTTVSAEYTISTPTSLYIT